MASAKITCDGSVAVTGGSVTSGAAQHVHLGGGTLAEVRFARAVALAGFGVFDTVHTGYWSTAQLYRDT